MTSKCNPLSCLCGVRVPMRVMIVLLCGLGAIVGYGQRANINLAITRLVSHQIRYLSFSCFSNSTPENETIGGGTKNWTERVQGYVLGSFYVGYLLGQIPSGLLADKYGPRWIYLSGSLCSTIICCVTPVIIHYTHWAVVVFSRIITGIGQSAIFPCISIFISRWVPFEERSTLGALAYTSASMGVILGNLGSGFIMYYSNNWPNVFYFWSGAGIIWCILFLIYCYNEAGEHPHLSEKEKVFLQERINKLTRLKPPWKKLLVDKGVIALLIGQMGHDMTLFLCVTNIPKYLSDVLEMSVRDVSMVSSLPFAGTWLSGIIAGRICDYISTNTNFSLKWNRGISTYTAFALPNSLLVLMMYAGCNTVFAIVFFTGAVFFMGPFAAGQKVNQMDITVNFNGIVMSIVNGIGCVSGFLTPVFISNVAWDNRLWQWQVVAWFVFLVSFLSATYYMFLLKVQRAEWDVPESELDVWKQERDAKRKEQDRIKTEKKAEKEAKKKPKPGGERPKTEGEKST